MEWHLRRKKLAKLKESTAVYWCGHLKSPIWLSTKPGAACGSSGDLQLLMSDVRNTYMSLLRPGIIKQNAMRTQTTRLSLCSMEQVQQLAICKKCIYLRGDFQLLYHDFFKFIRALTDAIIKIRHRYMIADNKPQIKVALKTLYSK